MGGKQERAPVQILTKFLNWNHFFGETRPGMALEQALHPRSIGECLPAGAPHITHNDAREVVWIFQHLTPDGLAGWLEDTKSLKAYGDQNVLLIAAAADLSARRKETEVICCQMREK